MGVKRGQGVIHKHYSMPVILLGTIGYAIIVVITNLRPLEGSADSMQWRRVEYVRVFAFFLGNPGCLGSRALLYPATEALRTESRSSSPLL
jgi:hypothetical protein